MTGHLSVLVLKEGKGIVKFFLVGLVSFLIYSGAYLVFTRSFFPDANLTLMNVLALCVSTSFNFTAHRGWTYRATHSASHTQIGRYLIVVVSSAVLQSTLFWFMVERLQIPDLYILVPIAGICALYTYFAHRIFTFKKPRFTENML